MVNKDQLEQTTEGQQALALMSTHFTGDQFQPALTLIEQLYIEDLTVWDATLNHDSKLPFERTSPAKRLLVFFDNAEYLENVKSQLRQREAATPAESPRLRVVRSRPVVKRKAKGKAFKKSAVLTAPARKRAGSAVKKKAQSPRRKKATKKPAKAGQSPRKKNPKSAAKKPVNRSRKKKSSRR